MTRFTGKKGEVQMGGGQVRLELLFKAVALLKVWEALEVLSREVKSLREA